MKSLALKPMRLPASTSCADTRAACSCKGTPRASLFARPPVRRGELRVPKTRIARVSKIRVQLFSNVFDESWSGTSAFGLGSPRRRISQCFCVCSLRGGQLCVRIDISETGKTKNQKLPRTRPAKQVTPIPDGVEKNKTGKSTIE